MKLNYDIVKNKFKAKFGLDYTDAISFYFSKDTVDDLVTLASWRVATEMVRAGIIADEYDASFNDFFLLVNLKSYFPALRSIPITIAVVDSIPAKVKIETTCDELIQAVLTNTYFNSALDTINNRDLEFYIFCCLINVIDNADCALPENLIADILKNSGLKESSGNREKYIDQYTGKVLLNYAGAEHIVADALKNFDTDWSNNTPIVSSKNRITIARAIMQAFKAEGYEPTLAINHKHKTHVIDIPDGEWSGVRISITTMAVIDPEKQLIEIEVYE